MEGSGDFSPQLILYSLCECGMSTTICKIVGFML